MSTSSATSPSLTTNIRQVWTKTVTDVANQTSLTATDIGSLVASDSRLNVQGTLNANEKQQMYSFHVLQSGKTKALLQGTAGTRVQVYNASGRVIADSKSGMGVASTNWAALNAGTLNMQAGKYYFKVTRDPTQAAASTPMQYVVQAQQGTSLHNDYITSESGVGSTASSATTPTYVGAAAGGIITNSINAQAGVTPINPFAGIVSGETAAASASIINATF